MDLSRGARLAGSRAVWVLGQAGLVTLGIFVYFRVRGLTEGSVDVAVEHAHDIAALEQRLGIDVETAAQGPVYHSPAAEALINWVYIWGHWPVIVATMVWLAWRHRSVFLRLRDGMLVSGAIGLVIFASYPVAPPRLADGDVIDTVTRSSDSYRVLQPPAFVNQYAAMPSLHSGWDLLVGIAIFTAATTVWLRAIGVLLPVAMLLAVVATGNHFVLDVVAGVALALFGHLVALRLERWRDARAGAAP
jgi:membrane-associated phospholipid phosphatase